MITESMLPMVLVPVTFLFVLLVILIAKAPKAGACVVGGLILLVPIFLYRLAMTGALRQEEAIPVVVMPLTFLFVLLVILLAKAPKAGAGLIVALVVMGLCALLLAPLVSYRRVASVEVAMEPPTATLTVPSPPAYHTVPPVMEDRAIPAPLPPVVIRQEPVVASPIWSEGVEKEFEADIYPSQAAAVRALGLRLDRAIRELTKDANTPPQITLFQESHERALVLELKNGIQQVLPQASCRIEAELRNIQGQEVGVALRLLALDSQPAPWARSPEVKAASGQIEVRVFTTAGQIAAERAFVEKPWIENFAAFTSLRPEQHFIVTRSRETCTSETEASRQAVDDARAQLTAALGKRPAPKLGPLPLPAISTTDVRQGGFIVDQFAQSFNGTAGKIWRHAILLDLSGAKLSRLADLKAREVRAQKMSWARMGFSALGVIVLIGVIYFFLNMATMGYYEWSLRIAGVILAIAAVLAILMVVH